ncbi:rhomboid family intramembrane serine protease [Pseudomonas sp.]|uniref:rhomboid family intramembrane serine protease n=1 Tax=Pseudomonas sp. TaxID=306 RepID=UPI0028B013B7|nr:rhomboid family intramembrane serine protease [Pseudomonas sp.]
MNFIDVLRLPLSTDLSRFVHTLQRLGLPHRMSEEGDVQVLWVPEDLVDEARELYEGYLRGDALFVAHALVRDEQPEPPAQDAPSLLAQAKACKVTAAVILLCLLVAGLTRLGDNLGFDGWFTFLPLHLEGELLYVTQLDQSLAEGQWWRLVSPMLLHFGVLHLAMNCLWFWELGRRVEVRQGSWALLGLTLLFSLVANLTQHFNSGPGLFGGLSGVLYGLLGYVWIFQRLAPNPQFALPRGVLVMMLIWLAVCLTGVVGKLGMGQIANGAHVGGLLVGCLTGLLGGALARRKLGAG